MFVLLLGWFILVFDQLTKQAVRRHLVYGESRPLIDGFFNLVYVRNDGAAWNILNEHGWILIFISLFMLVFLFYYRHSLFGTEGYFQRILLGLLLGGILGNLVDRIHFGWVTDFLDFEFGSYHYPSFNVADSSICIAVGLYFINNIFFQKKKETDDVSVVEE
jgi:signal peptidase II